MKAFEKLTNNLPFKTLQFLEVKFDRPQNPYGISLIIVPIHGSF